jgi:hypothetical protein
MAYSTDNPKNELISAFKSLKKTYKEANHSLGQLRQNLQSIEAPDEKTKQFIDDTLTLLTSIPLSKNPLILLCNNLKNSILTLQKDTYASE